MKAIIQATDTLRFEIEGASVQEIFEQIKPIQEVFHNCVCGKCGSSKHIQLVHRKVDKYDYYELKCVAPLSDDPKETWNKCNAVLNLGNDNGKLFARRYHQDPNDKTKPLMKDGKKVWKPDNGWMRWNKDKKEHY